VRQAGASHYLEHLLFKGTPTRSAREISASFDRVGGDVNAFTTKDHTCFHARVLGEDVPFAVDTLADMVVASLVRSSDVEAERGVILEEIAMDFDDPSDAVHDEFARALFGNSPLGRPVLGDAASIEGMSRSTIASYWRRAYRPDRMVVSAAGRVDHDLFVAAVEKVLGPWLSTASTGSLIASPRPVSVSTPVRVPSQPTRALARRTEQANLILGVRGLARTDERRFALAVLNAALGGGMSSLLFQEIREKRGLAYSVYSYTSGYADDGVFGIYVGCQPKRVREVVGLCREQLAAVAADGLSTVDLELGKGQVRGAILLAQEDTESRMSWWGKRELLSPEVLGVSEELRRIKAVTAVDVQELAADLLTRPLALATVGASPKLDLEALVA
jgi:predicted Zn-dependent peptidase